MRMGGWVCTESIQVLGVPSIRLARSGLQEEMCRRDDHSVIGSIAYSKEKKGHKNCAKLHLQEH